MYNAAYKKIAEGHHLMEEGYLELADCYLPDNIAQPEKKEKAKTARAKKEAVQPDKAEEVKAEESSVTVEMVRAVMAEKSQEVRLVEEPAGLFLCLRAGPVAFHPFTPFRCIERRLVFIPRKPKKPCKHSGCPELTDGNYCEEHAPLHQRTSAADRGDPVLFWDEGNWQPLCKHCHDVKTMADDRYQEYRY